MRPPRTRWYTVASAAERFLLALVLVVAAASVAVPRPGRAAASQHGIDVALAVLVFATGLSLRLSDLAVVRGAWRRITSPWRSAPPRCPPWPGRPASSSATRCSARGCRRSVSPRLRWPRWRCASWPAARRRCARCCWPLRTLITVLGRRPDPVAARGRRPRPGRRAARHPGPGRRPAAGGRGGTARPADPRPGRRCRDPPGHGGRPAGPAVAGRQPDPARCRLRAGDRRAGLLPGGLGRARPGCSRSAPPRRARPPCCCRWRCATSRSPPGSPPRPSARPPPLRWAPTASWSCWPARPRRRCGAGGGPAPAAARKAMRPWPALAPVLTR